YKRRFLKKIFSDEEISYLKEDVFKMCLSFSFKESIWKALPEKMQKKLIFNKIKIGWKNGKPFLLEEIGNYNYLLSYSITNKYVITLSLLFKL
ncbi:MAG: 4'-phosphopantetheinyl transferase superfamily protein, partial [bacterium]|nr:4'-phosphopantetheinyl transferase superfamily protein [bacterium]MDW8163740.1 4'-phosphopantetheinyl transferase superfamily protein [Candidatus Omnitrophota bacterium]